MNVKLHPISFAEALGGLFDFSTKPYDSLITPIPVQRGIGRHFDHVGASLQNALVTSVRHEQAKEQKQKAANRR